MISYKINMKLSGRMTQLPDSQKIFGALIYFYAEKTSEKQAEEFVSGVKEGRIFFTLSNMMPAEYLPVPQVYLTDMLKAVDEGGDGSNGKEAYSAIKNRHFVKRDQLKAMTENPYKTDEIYPYVKICDSQTIHAAIDSLRFDMPGLDSDLYSLPETHLVLHTKGQKENEGILLTEFQFYLCTEENSAGITMIRLLMDAQREQRPFFLGPRASQGMNTFYVEAVGEEEQEAYDSGGKYLNMGMLLPDKINLPESYIKLFTSQRCPYNRIEGWDKQEAKRFISFIQAGSIVAVFGDVRQAGKSISSPFDERAIVFGNAYLLPVFS